MQPRPAEITEPRRKSAAAAALLIRSRRGTVVINHPRKSLKNGARVRGKNGRGGGGGGRTNIISEGKKLYAAQLEK